MLRNPFPNYGLLIGILPLSLKSFIDIYYSFGHLIVGGDPEG